MTHIQTPAHQPTPAEHDSFADHPWILKLVDFTRKAYEDKRVKIFAICFGHQILARALGVKVGRNPKGWELAVCEVDLSEQGRELFGREKLVSLPPVPNLTPRKGAS